MIHPKDNRSNNPRLQCSVCAKWMRLHRAKPDPKTGLTQRFYGGCQYTGGDHLAGDHSDVCEDCCHKECKRLKAASLAPTTPEQCRAQTCDCPPGSCAFPPCIACDAPLLAGEAACCRACEDKHLTAGAAT